ncbi:50S ribosomal protein L2 [Candidatus Woesearchaeota archaeon]|nr:50S ribosomal protein L2 [Candidatus Woesearchaeota archaeon]
MGKRLIQQRRGKGSPTYKSPSHRFKGEIKNIRFGKENINGKITDLLKCPGHTGPLIEITLEKGERKLIIAPEGVRVGESLEAGEDVSLKIGNTLLLKNIPEGTSIFNIENAPGDGGKFVRASGTFAKVITQLGKKVIIQLPSKKKKHFNSECRATIGTVAGSGRTEKPFLKAGNKYKAMRAKNKLYPSISGTSMNSVDHPFGGTSSNHKGRPTIAPKNAPPGRKVGMLKPSKTGRGGKK